MPETTCPTPDDLAQMLNGMLDDTRLESVLEHVDQCPDCQRKVERVQTVDPLAESLSDLNGRRLRPTDNSWMERSSRSRAANEIQLPAEIGPYRLLDTIAVGGMGTVYEARHRRLGRPFAVKLLHSGSQMTRSEAEMVRSEWRTHGRLVHPNIVGATDAGIADGQPYLVTERVDGVDLSKLVRQHGPLRPADACEIVRQAADGLQYAHEQQVIHGDVKPSNLMLNRRGVVKLLDLGTAKQLDASGLSSSRSGTTHGTLAYMAPEQLTHRRDHESNADLRADIYSLGCTLYCLLSGHSPFGGDTEKSNSELIEAHRTEPPRRIKEFLAVEFADTAQLQTTLDRMLAKDPGDRFQSMDALLETITPLCGDHNVGGLLDQLGINVESTSESGAGGFDFTGGLTTLLKIGHTRRHWTVPIVAAGFLAIAATIFTVTRNNTESNNQSNDQLASLEFMQPEPTTYMARRSKGEDILHRSKPFWNSSPRAGSLDGLVLEPAKFSGIEGWQIETIAPRGRVRSLCWSADGEQIVTVSTDGHVRLFDWNKKRLSLRRIVTHRDHRFVAAAFQPESTILFACSAEKLMRIDQVTGKTLNAVDTVGAFDLEWVGGRNMVSVSSTDGIALYDPKTLSLFAELPVRCDKTSWSRDGGRVAFLHGNRIGVRRLVKTSFAREDIGYRDLAQNPHDIEFTTSIGQLAVVYPHRIELLARGNHEAVFSVATKARLESVTFGGSDDQMMIGTTDGIQRIKSTEVQRVQHRHQLWGRSQVAWNPKQECIAVGLDGVLQIVDGQMRQIDLIGSLKAVSDVSMHATNRYDFLLRSGKVVSTDDNGRILGWSTFLPDGTQVADNFVPTPLPSHTAAQLVFGTSGVVEIPVPTDAIVNNTERSDAGQKVELPIIRNLYHDGAYRIELWDDQSDQWQSIFQSELYVWCARLSPNGKRLAILADPGRLCIVNVSDGEKIFDRSIDEVPLQNVLTWIDDASVLIAGASNMRAKNIASFDVESKEFSWILREPHRCSAAEVAMLSPGSFLQAGDVHNVRSTANGEVVRSIAAEHLFGRRHGRIYREVDSSEVFSWGYDYSLSHASNASDGVVCWDAGTLNPKWMLVDVGEEETVTLTPAGQILSATEKATDGLVWMVDEGAGVKLKTFDEFGELTQNEK